MKCQWTPVFLKLQRTMRWCWSCRPYLTRQSSESWLKSQLKRSEVEDSFKAVFVNICGLVDVVTSVVVVAGTNTCGWLTVELFPETQPDSPVHTLLLLLTIRTQPRVVLRAASTVLWAGWAAGTCGRTVCMHGLYCLARLGYLVCTSVHWYSYH